MASTPDSSTMTRDELEERVSELEETVAKLEPLAELLDVRGDTDPAEADPTDVLLAGKPVGLALQKRQEENTAMMRYLFGSSLPADKIEEHIEACGTIEEDLAVAADSSDDGFAEAARDKMLPAHRMAVDIRHGHEERIKTDKSKRAAELFRRMMHKVSDGGDPQPGVDNSGGTVTIQSKDAGEIILEFDDDLDSAPSATVTRAFRQLQRLTKHEDCDCDSIDNCPHGLVMFQAGSTNKVVANTARLIDYLGDLDDLQTSEDGGDGADDGDHALEATADDAFDKLDAAEPAGDTNDVVSSNERTALGAQNDYGAGDNHGS